MALFSRVGRWPAALALCALTGLAPVAPVQATETLSLIPAAQPVAPPDDLVSALDDWLDGRAAWPRADEAPRISLISRAESVRLGGLPERGHGWARGLYDDATGTIYLVRPWSAKEPQDVAVLLHELVHHRQKGAHFYCPGAREEAAYRLQEAWLNERGLTADVNWIAVTLQAGCTPRDIHPD